MSVFTNQHFVFIIMLVSTVVSSAASVIGIFMLDYHGRNAGFWQYFLHWLYYLFHNLLPIGFALYVMNVNGSGVGRKRTFYVLFSLPFLISEVMVFTNRLTGFTFYMDENDLYHRGPLITLIYALGIFYFVFGFYSFFRYKKAISKNVSFSVGTVLIISALGVAVQAVSYRFAVELFSEALTLVGLMIMLEERGGYVDPLTGVFNRTALIDDSRRLIENNKSFRIVLIKLTDIDLFAKLVSDSDMDNIIVQVAEWLLTISSENTLYNYRSRDFAILCHGTSDLDTEYIVNAVIERFGREWKTGEATLRLEAVLSVLRIPEDVNMLEDLVDLLASGYKKRGAGSRVVSYEELFSNQRNRRIEEALRSAVEKKQLRVWYQPIWSVDEQRTVAAEALLRIDSDELRCISPAVYIPVAEQSDIIRDIGMFVFEDVCRFLKSISGRQLGISYIELNLSVHQFIYDDLVEHFEEIRKRYDIPTAAINLEITESASIGDTPVVGQTMRALRSLGYTFSLDDFGTGYSTLMQFLSSSYKNVKIDKSLLWESDRNEKSARLLDTMIRAIRSLGCNVVQEGVETESQLKRTERSGGNLIQGYYFSRPIPENDFITYLEKETRESFKKV